MQLNQPHAHGDDHAPIRTIMIPGRHETAGFAFLMSTAVVCPSSAVITFINPALVHGFFILWMRAFSRVFIVAFPGALVIVPIVRKIAGTLANRH